MDKARNTAAADGIDMSQCKICWAIAAVLGLISIVLVTQRMPDSTSDPSQDARAVVSVTAEEREMILEEMRGLLEAVQTIIVANNAGDLNTVAVAAREVGRENMNPRAAEFVAKLPLDFRKLGMKTHVQFDTLAADTEKFESTEHVFQQLGELTGNCVACHRSYRLATNEVN